MMLLERTAGMAGMFRLGRYMPAAHEVSAVAHGLLV